MKPERTMANGSSGLKTWIKRAKLPVLDSVRVASPCKAAWADMAGDERVRHCAQCDRDVFDLSEMTRDEAEALLLARGHLCIRYYRRADGTILLADCPVGAPGRRTRRRIVAGVVLVAGTAAACDAASRWVDRLNRRHADEMSECIGLTVIGEWDAIDRPNDPDTR